MRPLVCVLLFTVLSTTGLVDAAPLGMQSFDRIDGLEARGKSWALDLGHSRPWPGLALHTSWLRVRAPLTHGMRISGTLHTLRSEPVVEQRWATRLEFGRLLDVGIGARQLRVLNAPSGLDAEYRIGLHEEFGPWRLGASYLRAGIQGKAPERSRRELSIARTHDSLLLAFVRADSFWTDLASWEWVLQAFRDSAASISLIVGSVSSVVLIDWKKQNRRVRFATHLEGPRTGSISIGLGWSR